MLEASLAMPEEAAEVNTESCAEDDLVAYMKSLKYNDALVTDMMNELRREA